MFRWCARMGLILALALLLFSAYLMSKSVDPAEPALLLERPERDLGAQAIGNAHVVFRLTNRSERPIQVGGPADG